MVRHIQFKTLAIETHQSKQYHNIIGSTTAFITTYIYNIKNIYYVLIRFKYFN